MNQRGVFARSMKTCLPAFIVLMLACPSAGATVPVTSTDSKPQPPFVVRDDSASLERETSESVGTTYFTFHLTRPKRSRSYKPGQVWVKLTGKGPDSLVLAVPATEARDGRITFSLSVRTEAIGNYTLRIVDMTRRTPWHEFFDGPLQAIPDRKNSSTSSPESR